MKTVMQQLLERIEATINNDPVNDIGIGQAIGLKLVKDSIENEWLELEKQQIKADWRQGEVHGHNYYDNDYNEEGKAEQYYNQTYKSELK